MKKYTNTTQKSYAAGRRKRNARKNVRITAMKMKLKKGDAVLVVSGKDKGKEGKIMHVFPKTNRVIIDGVGMVKRHTRSSGRNKTSRIIEVASSIHASNVMLIDPESKKRTRVGRTDGARVAKKSKTVLK